METQLVRLDAPYNLICNDTGEFGLHIATLIVINDKEDEDLLNDFPDHNNRGVYSYPVVAEKYELAGEAWMFHSLKQCQLVASMNNHPSVTLRAISDILDYINRGSEVGGETAILKCASALKLYDVDIIVPSGHAGVFNVEIVFDIESGRSLIYSTPDSDLYFFSTFILHDEDADIKAAMNQFLRCRNAYLTSFSKYGLKEITFSTKDKEYQHYVDELNAKAHARRK